MMYLGIDLGGTFIKYGVVNAAGKILREDVKPTEKLLDKLLAQVEGIIKEYRETFNIQAVAIGIAGFVRRIDSCIVRSPNMPFLNGICFGNLIRDRVRMPIFLENDANLSAWGEYQGLMDPRPDSLVHITLGTGLGGGIILNGELWRGEAGFAGELGHVVVNPEGRTCGCGSRGCVETESTTTGIVTSYHELSGEPAGSALDVFKKAEKNDRFAIKCFQRAGYYLGIFLATVVHMLNPAVISIGGGVAGAGDRLFDPAMAELKSRVIPDFLSGTAINIRKNDGSQGFVGAAEYAKMLTTI